MTYYETATTIQVDADAFANRFVEDGGQRMSTSKTMPWVLGTAVLALAIIAGAWLLLISPGLSAAADSRQQAESEQSRIDQLQLQLVQLKKDYANLDDFKATARRAADPDPADGEHDRAHPPARRRWRRRAGST